MVQGPIRHRTRRNVGRPTAAVIRRTWRFRPSVISSSSQEVGISASADGRVARPEILWRADAAGAGRLRKAVAQFHAALQGTQGILPYLTFHLHPVGLGELVAGLGDGGLQRAVVGEGHEPLAVAVEPAGRIDAGHRHEVGEAGVAALGRELAKDAVRLVEKEQSTHGRRPDSTPLL